MFTVIAEELSDGASGVRSQELKRGGFGSSSSHNDGVVKGVMSLECLDDVGDGGSFLTNGDVDAEELSVIVTSLEVGPLVDDGIDGNGGLACLSVTNDQLSLSSSDGHQSVDCFQSGLHRLVHRFSGDNARGLYFNSLSLGSFDWAETINRVSEGVKHTTQHLLSNRDVDDGAGSGDGVSLLDFSG